MGWEDPLEEEMATHPVFLTGEFHEQRSLVGYSQWSPKEQDMTEQLTLQLPHRDSMALILYVFNLS